MPRNLIKVDTDLGPKSFNSVHDLSNWIEEQINEWSEFQASTSCQRLNQIVTDWRELANHIDHILNSEITGKEQAEKSQTTTQRYFSGPIIISRENPALKISREFDNGHAMNAFFMGLMGDKRNLALNDQNRINGFIKGCIASGKYTTHLVPGINKLNAASKKNLSELENIKSEIRDLTEQQISNNETQSDLIVNLENRLELLKSAFNASITGVKIAYDNFIEDAHNRVTNIENTYREHMSLRASVNYWSDQVTHHEKWSNRSLAILVAVTLLTIGSIIAFGYLSLEITANISTSIKEIPYYILLKGLIAALLLSFAVWAIRICNKTWHIHRHLKQDAQERVTMMKTYLALLSEDNLKDNDVELILTSLFRPSYDGIIKDDTAPRSVLDFVLRENSK